MYLTKAAELETRETQRKDYRNFLHGTSELRVYVSPVLWRADDTAGAYRGLQYTVD